MKWWLVILACTVGQAAFAASVKSVNAKKFLVAIDLEEDETVEKDTTICIYDGDGKKVDCGNVVKFKGTVAIVKMPSKKKLKKIEAGMAAKIGEGDEAPAEGENTAAVDKKAKKGKKAKKKKGKNDADAAEEDSGDNAAKETKVYKGKKSPMRFWGFYSAALATPSTFNKLGYTPPTTATPDTLWSSDKTVSQALLGFNLQAGIPVGSFSVNPGFRYRKFTPSLVDANYQPQQENPYVRVEESATAIGFWADFQYFRMPILTASSFWLSSGLDIDSSTVTVTATKKDDGGGTDTGSVAKATSKLTVASLRLGGGVDLVVAKPFGLFLGTTLMLPLAEFGKKFSGSIDDNEGRGVADPGDDLKKQLDHKKAKTALEISLGAMLSL